MTATRRGVDSAAGIREAACDLFYSRGFQAATLRQIAGRVGLQVGSLYNHIESKRDLLFEIMETILVDLLTEQRAVAETADVVERLRLLVQHHVRFHASRAKEVFIGNSELRSLSSQQSERIVALRREYERLFEETLQAGIAEGKFVPTHVRVAVYGVIAMTSGVAGWYSPRGRLSPDQIAETYSGLVVRGMGARRGAQSVYKSVRSRASPKRGLTAAGAPSKKMVIDKR